MHRAVILTGFGTGGQIADNLSAEIRDNYVEDALGYTMTRSRRNADVIRKLVDGQLAITHSAGLRELALSGARPKEVIAFNPPVPTTPARLALKTVNKTARMFAPGMGIKSPADVLPVIEWNWSSIGELSVHPWANLKRAERYI